MIRLCIQNVWIYICIYRKPNVKINEIRIVEDSKPQKSPIFQ